jgi:hypothetical protein
VAPAPCTDDEFDIEREKAGEDAELQPEAEPPEWDIDAPLQPAPFNVMLTCYTLFERDRCARGRPAAAPCGAGVGLGTACAGCRWLKDGTVCLMRDIPDGLLRRVCLQLNVLSHPASMFAFAPPPLHSPEQRLDRGFLEKWRWSHLIMDEAHALKNRNASRTTRLRRVSNASRRRIMMTGGWRPGGVVVVVCEGGRRRQSLPPPWRPARRQPCVCHVRPGLVHPPCQVHLAAACLTPHGLPLQAPPCRTTWLSCRTCCTSCCPRCLRRRALRTWQKCCRWVG